MSLRNRASLPEEISPWHSYHKSPSGDVNEEPAIAVQLLFPFALELEALRADSIPADSCSALKHHSIGVGWRRSAQIFAELERDVRGSAA